MAVVGGSAKGNDVWIFHVLTTATRRRWTNRNGGVKTAAWRTFGRRSTRHRAVKNERVIVQGPVKKPPMSRALSLCPATVPLTASAGFNGVCNRQ